MLNVRCFSFLSLPQTPAPHLFDFIQPCPTVDLDMSKPDQIAQIRAATGLAWPEAQKFVEEKPAELCERIIRAKTRPGISYLYDPTEDDPALAQQFADANQKAEAAFQSWMAARNARLLQQGLSHMVSKHLRDRGRFIWREKKKILLEQHGINWFTPVEMNPCIVFD
jgi:hypothetical protein